MIRRAAAPDPEEEPPRPTPRLDRPQFEYGADSVLAQAPLDAASGDDPRPDTLEEKFKLFRSRLVLALVEGKYPAFRRTMGGRLRCWPSALSWTPTVCRIGDSSAMSWRRLMARANGTPGGTNQSVPVVQCA